MSSSQVYSRAIVPHYEVLISEPVWRDSIEPGEPYPEMTDAWRSGDAESPEQAVERARAVWRERYGEDPPGDAEVKVTPGPNVCPRCEGRGWLQRSTAGLIDPGEDSPLGSAAKRTCPDCAGTGNVTQRR
jgi:hypothetical protein